MSYKTLRKVDELKTPRLSLKAYEENDKNALVDLLLNEEIKRTFMIPDFKTREEAEVMYNQLKDFSHSKDHFEYGIFLKDKLIGFINDCVIEKDTIELGYVIHPDYRGNGYAPEALRAAINELFRVGYNHIIAAFFEENPSSKRVLEKCGMQKLNKDDYIEYQGSPHHCFYYGISKSNT